MKFGDGIIFRLFCGSFQAAVTIDTVQMQVIFKMAIYTLFTFVLLLIFYFLSAFIGCIRLYCYLKKNNYALWKELAFNSKFGIGGVNIFKWLPYLSEIQDNEDKKILKLKNNIRKTMGQIGRAHV